MKVKELAPPIAFYLLMAVSPFAISAQDVPIDKTEELESRISTLESDVKKTKKIRFSGYIQGDMQIGEENASLKVGSAKADGEDAYIRFGIRRGRLKFAYADNIGKVASTAVFQLDITERGVGIKDAYFAVTDPWINLFSVQIGVFDRPFGNEISYSSSVRETPERSTGCTTLFPGERDLGGKLVIAAPKTHALAGLQLETGVFGGNGINLDNDNKKDWISHLYYKKAFDNIRFGVGASCYLGSVYEGTDTTYKMNGKGFVCLESSEKGAHAKRRYYGFDAQLLIKTKLGETNIRAEVITGQQPGALGDSKSPSNAALPSHNTYERNFLSYYVYFIQDFGKHSVVLKYDRYDPNTKTGNDDIGLGGTGKGDIMKQNFGFGYLFRLNSHIRLMAYYDMAFNETSKNLAGFSSQLKDNIFTLRLQYKF